MLFKAASYILDTAEEDLPESWQKVADAYTQHSAREWRSFFKHEVKRVYLRHVEDVKKVKKTTQGDPGDKPSIESQRSGQLGSSGEKVLGMQREDLLVDRPNDGRSSVQTDQRTPETVPSKELLKTTTPDKVESSRNNDLRPLTAAQSLPVKLSPAEIEASPKRPIGRPRKYLQDETRRQSRDQGAQTSPTRYLPDNSSALGTPSRAKRLHSPEFQPESPTNGRQPGPNEARKRSATKGTSSKGNSQESNSSISGAKTAMNGSIESQETTDRTTKLEQTSSPLKRKRMASEEESGLRSLVVPSIEDIIESQQSKRSKRMHPSTVVHEEKRGTPVAEVTSIRMREVEIELSELLTDEDVDGLDLPIIRPTKSPVRLVRTNDCWLVRMQHLHQRRYR